jgi:Amt family ammonium transporter
MLAGAGLLWMGWAGFNGGDPYSANIDSSIAVINTNICAATSLLMWTSLDVLVFGKPSVIGAVQGMITGLVVITPAAGKGSFTAEFHSCLKKKTLCSRTNNTLEC